MENPSNRFVLRIKFLITFFRNGSRILEKKVVEVQIDGAPVLTHEKKDKTGVQPQSVSKNSENSVRIWIDIRISNGLHLSQKNLSYQDLVRMVENLEVLC